jgi:FkbM family methyltransferase
VVPVNDRRLVPPVSAAVQALSMRMGHLLYQRSFPVYRILYDAYKRWQDAVEIAWIQRLVRPGSHVLDIGANIGFYTWLLSDLVGPEGHVHAFEPDATNFARLSARAAHRSNVTLVRRAVSDGSGPLTIYTSPTLNVDHRTYRVDGYERAMSVDGVSIDDYVGGRFRVDAVKMDIQGYELHALRGMEQTLAANPAVLVFSELWPHGFRQCGTDTSHVCEYIRSLGFAIWLPEREGLRPVTASMIDAWPESEARYANVILSRRPIG